jgi:hypothetical protein
MDLLRQTGTRLTDWVDHLVVPEGDSSIREAAAAGYAFDRATGAWRHAAGMFPPLVAPQRPMHADLKSGAAIKAESVDYFLQTHHLAGKVMPTGTPGGPLQFA